MIFVREWSDGVSCRTRVTDLCDDRRDFYYALSLLDTWEKPCTVPVVWKHTWSRAVPLWKWPGAAPPSCPALRGQRSWGAGGVGGGPAVVSCPAAVSCLAVLPCPALPCRVLPGPAPAGAIKSRLCGRCGAMEAAGGRALLAAVGLLSALSAAGTLFLLAQWRELGAALRELEAAGNGSVRGPAPAPAPAARTKRSCRGERARGHVRTESDEMMLMLTYSMVPVRPGGVGTAGTSQRMLAFGRSCCPRSERTHPVLRSAHRLLCRQSCWAAELAGCHPHLQTRATQREGSLLFSGFPYVRRF